MDSKLRLVLQLLIIPNLRSAAGYFSMKDADAVGNDDRISRLLSTAATELELYIAESQAAEAKTRA